MSSKDGISFRVKIYIVSGMQLFQNKIVKLQYMLTYIYFTVRNILINITGVCYIWNIAIKLYKTTIYIILYFL